MMAIRALPPADLERAFAAIGAALPPGWHEDDVEDEPEGEEEDHADGW